MMTVRADDPPTVTIAHLSDVHLPFDDRFRPAMMLSKQLFGWLTWRFRRRRLHLTQVIDRLLDDLRDQAPDHVLITGDIVNLSLATEFTNAAAWLGDLGAHHHLSVVPGNHDAYVWSVRGRSWSQWSRWFGEGDSAPAAGRGGFPYVRRVGPVAIVGLASAVPMPPCYSAGRLGRRQLDRLSAVLRNLDGRSQCRIVALHHPPVDPGASRRKRLLDAGSLATVLRAFGAELVVHGHTHRFSHRALPGPDGPIPVIGVPSASSADDGSHPSGQYHLYRICAADSGWAIRLAARRYEPSVGRFVAGPAYAVSRPADTVATLASAVQ